MEEHITGSTPTYEWYAENPGWHYIEEVLLYKGDASEHQSLDPSAGSYTFEPLDDDYELFVFAAERDDDQEGRSNEEEGADPNGNPENSRNTDTEAQDQPGAPTGDDIPDYADPDNDNDGIDDIDDPCPEDFDCDDDGIPDGEDPCPENPDCDDDGIFDGQDPCPEDSDCDDDGLEDGQDPCPQDTDCDDDGLPDNSDPCPTDPDKNCDSQDGWIFKWTGNLNNEWNEPHNWEMLDLSLQPIGPASRYPGSAGSSDYVIIDNADGIIQFDQSKTIAGIQVSASQINLSGYTLSVFRNTSNNLSSWEWQRIGNSSSIVNGNLIIDDKVSGFSLEDVHFEAQLTAYISKFRCKINTFETNQFLKPVSITAKQLFYVQNSYFAADAKFKGHQIGDFIDNSIDGELIIEASGTLTKVLSNTAQGNVTIKATSQIGEIVSNQFENSVTIHSGSYIDKIMDCQFNIETGTTHISAGLAFISNSNLNGTSTIKAHDMGQELSKLISGQTYTGHLLLHNVFSPVGLTAILYDQNERSGIIHIIEPQPGSHIKSRGGSLGPKDNYFTDFDAYMPPIDSYTKTLVWDADQGLGLEELQTEIVCLNNQCSSNDDIGLDLDCDAIALAASEEGDADNSFVALSWNGFPEVTSWSIQRWSGETTDDLDIIHTVEVGEGEVSFSYDDHNVTRDLAYHYELLAHSDALQQSSSCGPVDITLGGAPAVCQSFTALISAVDDNSYTIEFNWNNAPPTSAWDIMLENPNGSLEKLNPQALFADIDGSGMFAFTRVFEPGEVLTFRLLSADDGTSNCPRELLIPEEDCIPLIIRKLN